MGETVLTSPTDPIQIRPGEAGRLIVLVPYTPERVAKIKTVVGRRWHPEEKYWTVPHTNRDLAHLLALFAQEPVEVEPSLRPVRVPDHREPLHEPTIRQGGEQALKLKRLSQAGQAPPRGGGLRRVVSGSIPAVAPDSMLLDRVRQAIRARHYSQRTEEAYAGWIKRFICFHGKRHPAELGEPEVNQFLTHLAVHERIAASTQNQALAALLFLYGNVLNRPLGQLEGVVRARRPRRLPVVLIRQEVRAVLDELDGTPRLVCTLLYGSGLRLLECLRLRVKDIDVHRHELTVRDGKGLKDRVTMLPAVVREPLEVHLEKVRRQHAEDLAQGLGRAPLPDAIARKYPNADRQWVW